MKFIHSVALYGSASLLAVASPAFAQSTGSVDFEKDIVVTARVSDPQLGGVITPLTTKAKAALDQSWITRQTPGQTVNDMINYLPGVNFQNNDPYGSAGGTLTIRGFDATRISETFDGVTLNDDGNYALYASELLDSEVIDSVTVSLGSTDVDSPTSSASGSTVNFRSHEASDDFHAKMSGSAGSDDFFRVFGMIDTGRFGPFGTKAWASASTTQNNSPFNNYGKIKKDEYNAKIYQPLGSNGDFISLAGFYVKLRNNFSGSVPLSNVPLAADSGAGLTGMPSSYSTSYYTYAGCTTTPAVAGHADAANSCGSAYDYRANPTNIGNIRAAARITITPQLVWTIDPSYQITKANGGGTVVASEGTLAGSTGFIGGKYYFGRDLNGDGDTLDSVRLLAPSETMTHRVALTSSLRYDVAPHQSLRLAYAYSHSAIAQTGELNTINANGSPTDVFPADAPLVDASGNVVQKRDTHSVATLNQISGEYRGKFLDNKLSLDIGVRAPFLTRDLTNYCFIRNAGGSVTCAFGAAQAAYATANPTYAAPQARSFSYNAVLPNAGLTYKLPWGSEAFFNYSKGYSAPQTTALYQAFWFPSSDSASQVKPEKTDNFDLGYRYASHTLTAQVDLWYTHFTNRLGTAYNPTDSTSIYSNLGTVNRYGIDGNVAWKPNHYLTAYAFGSWLHSRIEDNVQSSATGFLATAGKFESGVPQSSFGGRLQGNYGPLTIGAEVKRTGPRYVNDQNLPYTSLGNAPVVADGTVVYGAKTPAYTVVDLDVRFALTAVGLNDRSYFQLNATNLFNQFYVGGFSGTTSSTQTYTGTLTNAQIGAPRAVMGTLVFGY